jgi:hypothetical protein
MPHQIFLNPGLVRCKENCLSRPHEPQKYATAQEQDRMLEFLLQWVEEYYHRADEMSLAYHAQVFSDYSGPKEERV